MLDGCVPSQLPGARAKVASYKGNHGSCRDDAESRVIDVVSF